MLISIRDTQRFSDFLVDSIEANEYKYKYLNTLLGGLFSHRIQAGANSFVILENDCWILFIEIDGQLFIYGHEYLNSQIEQFRHLIDLASYKGYEIMGTLHLVYKILNNYQIEGYEIIKDRNFYQLNDYIGRPEEVGIEAAASSDINEIVELFQDYYIEEYNGKRNKTADFLRPEILRHIGNSTLFVVKENNIVKGFCPILDPDIGVLFTRKEFRGQGIGKRLMEFCSSLLYFQNGYVNVMTDMHNVPSNRICNNIGFELIYQHTNLKL